ncbi:MAG: hypothetical protein P3X24_006080 [bacterium]|nr:hypothetical protein [bacterium]
MATNSYIGKGVGLLVMLSVASAQAQTLTWLGTLNYQSSIADDISADGRVALDDPVWLTVLFHCGQRR